MKTLHTDSYLTLERLVSTYVQNPYVVLGLGENCKRVMKSARDSQYRIQKLVLLSPPLWKGDEALEMRRILLCLVDLGVEIEVYVWGEGDCEAILEFFAPFGLVQWWKRGVVCLDSEALKCVSEARDSVSAEHPNARRGNEPV